jgi:hypothetical protein
MRHGFGRAFFLGGTIEIGERLASGQPQVGEEVLSALN